MSFAEAVDFVVLNAFLGTGTTWPASTTRRTSRRLSPIVTLPEAWPNTKRCSPRERQVRRRHRLRRSGPGCAAAGPRRPGGRTPPADCAGMVNDELLFEEPPAFAELVARCRSIQDRATTFAAPRAREADSSERYSARKAGHSRRSRRREAGASGSRKSVPRWRMSGRRSPDSRHSCRSKTKIEAIAPASDPFGAAPAGTAVRRICVAENPQFVVSVDVRYAEDAASGLLVPIELREEYRPRHRKTDSRCRRPIRTSGVSR